MPIATRSLDYARLQKDGRFRCRVSIIDTKGRVHVVGPFWADSLIQAQAVRDTATPDLQAIEEREILELIEANGDPDTYPREEMTLTEMRFRLLRRLARHAGFNGGDSFLCGIAPYITRFTATQIANFLGVTQQQAQRILDRAIRLENTICPALALDAADKQDL